MCHHSPVRARRGKGDGGEHALFASFVLHDEDAVDPEEFLPLALEQSAAEAILPDEVRQVHADIRRQPAFARQFACRTGREELSERIGLAIGVAPEPPVLALVRRELDGVLPGDVRVEQRLFDRRRLAQDHAVAVDAFPANAIQPLGLVHALDLERGRSAGRQIDRAAAKAEAVGGELVAVAGDGEIDLPAEQRRIIDRDPAGGVGDEQDVADGLQFHQRHAATGLFVDDLNAEGSGTVVRGSGQRREGTDAKGQYPTRQGTESRKVDVVHWVDRLELGSAQ